ncbi:hypothetical protein SeMB42_g01064 [Synchytrium endobioticum]|uniref:SHSP domain-containing protein n=1 Tax=Synchytrium endobioticum TaxID=286115 RepID=A0A507CI18_9FUNG|nr:hypothetical protein SeLEV6574_g07469 [Synchytrium endobioticum]TPX53002.1 hypothetical protein SeMB42_g01064 [Synchytrium endobioticum]
MAFFLRDTFDDPFFTRSPLDLLVALDAPRRIQSGQGEAASKDGKASGAVAQSEDKGRGLGRFRAPRVDVEETDKQYVIKADLPGMKKEEVQVHLKDDVLTIEGERRDDREEHSSNRHVVERSFGRFSRSIQMPPDADLENVQGNVENGVLRIAFNKKPTPQETKKQIPIN